MINNGLRGLNANRVDAQSLRIGFCGEGSFVEENSRSWCPLGATWIDILAKMCYDMSLSLDDDDDDDDDDDVRTCINYAKL